MSFSHDARLCCIAAGKLMNVSASELISPLRGSPAVASARQVAMWLLYEWKRVDSWSELGRQFSRDRTTVRHGVHVTSSRMIADEAGFARKVRTAIQQLRAGG